VKACVILLVAVVAALAITSLCTNNGIELQTTFQQGLMLKSWGALAGASIVTAFAAVGIDMLIKRFLSKIVNKVNSLHFSNLWLPLVAALLGGLFLFLLLGTSLASLLPESIAGRVENINFNQHSVRERGYFYLDAIRIFKDYPLFGTGGGGWSSLYQSYQSYPYVSRQSHNFFVQILDDVGIFGSLIIFSFIIIILALYIRYSIKEKHVERHSFPFFILAVALLGHALIDFDMSYAFISALVYISLGGLFAASRGSSPSVKYMSYLNKYKWLYPTFLGLISLVMIVVSYRMYLGNGKAQAVLDSFATGEVNLEDTQVKLDGALKLHPTNTDYALLKVNLYNQSFTQDKNPQTVQDGEKILQKLEKNEPYLIESYEYRYSWAMEQGQYAAAIENAEGLLRQNPWSAVYYERAMYLHQLLGEQAKAAKDSDTSTLHWNRVLELSQQVLAQQARIAKVPKSITIGSPLVVTRNMALPLGEVQYARGSYAEASATLQPFLTADLEDQANKLVIRYYLAALTKQGLSDPSWYDKLIAKDVNEKAAIEQLVAQGS
ncbi:MAG: O-antigen ligase family protein, partial [Gorillibacterium sp.]|nr:O-antigen ligase family protein [Gorillibacterium sp.]